VGNTRELLEQSFRRELERQRVERASGLGGKFLATLTPWSAIARSQAYQMSNQPGQAPSRSIRP